jgi:hypothetical protein
MGRTKNKGGVGEPFLVLETIQNGKYSYLRVVRHSCENKNETVQNFGSARIRENWVRAIKLVINLRIDYQKQRQKDTLERYISSMNKFFEPEGVKMVESKLYHCPVVDEDIPNEGDCPHVSTCKELTPECMASLCDSCTNECKYVGWRMWRCAKHRSKWK